jgi:hypothetical protein
MVASCTDVVDVNVQTTPSRLVIEASLDWEKDTAGNNQTISLRITTPYFNNTEQTPVIGASVIVTNNNTQDIFVFTDMQNGNYTTNSFAPIINNTYTLTVEYNNQVYTGTETLYPLTGIQSVTQSTQGGFDAELLEVNISFQDPEDEENYYLIRYYERGDLLPELETDSDEFSNGNLKTDFFEKEENEDTNEEPFEPGDVVDISLYSISKRYYNFMSLLLEQYDSEGDPFAAIPAKLKGNCTNITEPENYPLGYFRITEVDKTTHTFN